MARHWNWKGWHCKCSARELRCRDGSSFGGRTPFFNVFQTKNVTFSILLGRHGTVQCSASKARQTLIQAAQSGKLLAALQAATAKTAKVGSRTWELEAILYSYYSIHYYHLLSIGYYWILSESHQNWSKLHTAFELQKVFICPSLFAVWVHCYHLRRFVGPQQFKIEDSFANFIKSKSSRAWFLLWQWDRLRRLIPSKLKWSPCVVRLRSSAM